MSIEVKTVTGVERVLGINLYMEEQSFKFSSDGKFQYIGTVEIPSNVESLPNSEMGFKQHTETTKLIIAPRDTTLTFNSYSCSGCTNLVDIEIPDGVNIVMSGGYEFQNCNSLTDEAVQRLIDHVTTFSRNRSFQYCTNIEEITVPDLSSGEACFANCTNLKKVTVTGGTAIGKGHFSGCTALETVIVPDTVTYLGDSPFYNCTALTNFTFPDNLTKIDWNCFHNTGLVEVDLPATLTSLSNGSYPAFGDCTKLKKVTLRSQPSYNPGYWGSKTQNPFANCTAIEEFNIPENWQYALNLSMTNNLTHDTLVSIITNLHDCTGETARALTIGATNLAKLSEEEIAVATAKNWTVN